MKINRIFRRVSILVIATRVMTTYFKELKRTGKHCYKALDNTSEVALISQHPKLEELPYCLICFCSLFPPNNEFHRDTLIRLWVAQGFFDPKLGRKMEAVANEHFEDMFKKKFIVQSRFDIGMGVTRRMKYKVDNIIVPTSSYLWVQEAELSSTDREVQHLLLLSKNFDEATFKTLKSFRRLRTLILFCQNGDSIKRVPYDLFLKLQHLRTLDLHATEISELPGYICYLSSLHYLDVSETQISYLPESIGSLCHLQTLKLERCLNFYSLPDCTSKLINLRHLDLDILGQLTRMPVGMGNLTSLQTLKGFILGKGKGYDARELKHLTDVCGSFCISRLENISSVEQAREVDMSNKKHINKLELQWQRRQDDLALLDEIFECLQPHSSLEELQISFYEGSRFPTWMSNSYFSNIVSITLFECKSSSYLPSLGGLPSLKYLFLFYMYGVRSIDHHFCRYEGSQIGAAFPKLEKLTINGMPELEKWTGVENGDFPCLLRLSVLCCPKLIAVPMLSFPNSLKVLEISDCDELQSFPEVKLSSKLESLYIANCPLVKNRFLKTQGEDWSKIEHIHSIVIDNVEMSSKPNMGQDH
ncbi:putative disease resistance RPP13-like protein 1 isoform X2 [Lycium ferocissimum]|uniref:putative disease resistance RPP13-like protein 1 isoform X2 n=1 Tax=Lycium ferocissimum TaxID=112874 RepID=UPI00281625DD|nr:putative disease resistance RPP13-like protein 1 isoform X2 [Lycium ferocissimum]XP_059286040.1 putative disease resistance RPP13-like protein 1 isoform X2 [Lycium ferocissimum]XP_059286041.1 putative disease resistance RPP13-like protein 1 isoform X2 [Lycium ferocissimum]